MNKQTTWLAIDTSTATMAGAIASGEQQLASVQTQAERNHSIHIMTNIEAMLNASGLHVNELDGIVTGIGPGSYTGVRIAVTAAKTLAWICNKPLVGVSSLAALAFSGALAEVEGEAEADSTSEAGADVKFEIEAKAGAECEVETVAEAQLNAQKPEHAKSKPQSLSPSLVLPLMDARRGQVYTAAFEIAVDESIEGKTGADVKSNKNAGAAADEKLQQCRRLHADHIVLMEQWCQHWSEQLAELQARGIVRIALYGDIAPHQQSIASLQQAAERYGIEVVASASIMNGKALALLGQGKWLEERITPAEAHELVPNYAQLTEAEVKQNAKEREEGKA